MTKLIEQPGGSDRLTQQLRLAKVDIERYLRNQAGESIIDIAIADNVLPKTVQQSIRTGQSMWEMQRTMYLKGLKIEGAIENEEGRRDLRALIPKLKPTVESLLDGEKPIVQVIRETGEVTIKYVKDPEMQIAGVKLLQELISMQEKPAQNQTTVNIQQNNVAGEMGGGTGTIAFSMEERLDQIRARQEGRKKVIDAEATPIEEPAQPVEAHLVDEPKAETGDEWTF